MQLKAGWVLLAFFLSAFAGCLSLEKPGESLRAVDAPLPELPVPIDDDQLGLTGLLFDPHVLLDGVRPGGDAVIAVTPKGTLLVSANPGFNQEQLDQVDPDWLQSLSGENMMWRSTDHGKTWIYIGLPVVNAGPRDTSVGMSNPDLTVDSAGNVYSVYIEQNQVYYTAWSAKGEAFLQDFQITNLTGTHLWPWVVAGDEGRLGIAWIGSDKATSVDDDAEWSLYAAIVENATTDTPTFHVNKATAKPIHKGSISEGGGSGDRRLGNLLTANIDTDGRLVIVSGGTTNLGSGADGGSHSHPLFVHQGAGPLLRASAKA